MSDINEEIAQARQIAAYGFERGFDFVVDFLGSIQKTTNSEEGRMTLGMAIRAFELMRPNLIKEMPDWFTFDVVKLPDGTEQISIK